MSQSPPSDRTTQASRAQLVLYGTGRCADVRGSRALLDGAGVPHRYVDLEQDPDATRLVRRLQRGRRRIPTLVRPDGDHLIEPNDSGLQAWLNAHTGAPGPDQDPGCDQHAAR